MELEKKLKILKITLNVLIVLAAILLILHAVHLFNLSLYKKIDGFLLHIPSGLDKIFPVKIDFGNRKVPSGCYAVALACLAGIFSSFIMQKTWEEQQSTKAAEMEKKKFIIEAKNKREQEKVLIKQSRYKETFFGLFEIDVKYSDNFGKDLSQLEKLKIGYYKILVNKLKSKYYEVEFIDRDKLFLVSNNYSLLSSLTKDILRILGIYIKTGKDKQLITEMRFSYMLGEKTANKMNIFKTLSKINELDNINKIMLTQELYSKIIAVGPHPWCEVKEIGTVTLFKVYNNNIDIPVSLCEITNIY